MRQDGRLIAHGACSLIQGCRLAVRRQCSITAWIACTRGGIPPRVCPPPPPPRAAPARPAPRTRSRRACTAWPPPNGAEVASQTDRQLHSRVRTAHPQRGRGVYSCCIVYVSTYEPRGLAYADRTYATYVLVPRTYVPVAVPAYRVLIVRRRAPAGARSECVLNLVDFPVNKKQVRIVHIRRNESVCRLHRRIQESYCGSLNTRGHTGIC